MKKEISFDGKNYIMSVPTSFKKQLLLEYYLGTPIKEENFEDNAKRDIRIYEILSKEHIFWKNGDGLVPIETMEEHDNVYSMKFFIKSYIIFYLDYRVEIDKEYEKKKSHFDGDGLSQAKAYKRQYLENVGYMLRYGFLTFSELKSITRGDYYHLMDIVNAYNHKAQH